MISYRNVEAAFLGELRHLYQHGSEVVVRGSETRESVGRTFAIERPLERCITVPARLNNVAASIVETMWILAGRNDIQGLLPYLPRAGEFSDDGSTWRAGYGPRLRDWHGVDQVDAVRRLLVADPTSRRGVISLFDPEVDYEPSLDVPCNNWLHFIRRGDALDLSIAVRSNDVVWGFSGINTFEWSVLHELMAQWTGSRVGNQHWLVSSMHVYDRHYARADAILAATPAGVARRYPLDNPRYAGSFGSLDSAISTWFELEAMVRSEVKTGPDFAARIEDPLFRAFLQVVIAYWAIERGDLEAAHGARDAVAGTDLAVALDEYGARRLDGWRALGAGESISTADEGVLVENWRITPTRDALKNLHAMKSAAYGDSWKRRGELLGVLANVARKIDRLENREAWARADLESQLDTVSDLVIYLVKYQTFLADENEGVRSRLFGGEVPTPVSEGTEGVDYLLESTEATHPTPSDVVKQISQGLDRLLEYAQGGPGSAAEKSLIIDDMTRLTMGWLLSLHHA